MSQELLSPVSVRTHTWLRQLHTRQWIEHPSYSTNHNIKTKSRCLAKRGKITITENITVCNKEHLFCSSVWLCDSNKASHSTCVSSGPYCERDPPSPVQSVTSACTCNRGSSTLHTVTQLLLLLPFLDSSDGRLVSVGFDQSAQQQNDEDTPFSYNRNIFVDNTYGLPWNQTSLPINDILYV